MEIQVRDIRPYDARALYRAVDESRADIAPYLPWCTTCYDLQEAKAWCDSAESCWREGVDYRFAILDRSGGQLLGSVGINQISGGGRCGNLGYWVRSSVLGRGVCTRAAREVAHRAFAQLGFWRLEIHVMPHNDASNAVARKLGAEFEGCCRNLVAHGGLPTAANRYSLIPQDLGVSATNSC